MAVLQRKELEESPLADLHAIASELGLEGYRRLRRADLISAILEAQGEDDGEAVAPGEEPLGPAADQVEESVVETDGREGDAEVLEPAPEPDPEAVAEPAVVVDEEPEPEPEPSPELAAGPLDILSNGSGFLRVDPMGQSPGDVYVSPSQIRRCELRAGDEVSGPVRPPRRNERHPSLVRVESVNGREPEPPEERPRFEDLTPVFPTERLAASPPLDAVPFGKGSRVAVAGPPGAGATTLLRELVAVIAERHPEAQLAVSLVGVRPEEVTEWRRSAGVPVTGGGFDRSIDAETQAAELAVERGKRVVERGGAAVVVIDSLEALPAAAARRIFGAARKAEEGGSLTIVASTGMAWEPQRWASTRVMLDAPGEPGAGPSVSRSRSSTLRADLLG